MRTSLQMIGTLSLLLGLVSGTIHTASADSFDDAAKLARPVHGAGSLAALFWSQEASCGKEKSDLLRRQCQGVQRARSGSVSELTYLVEVAGPAVDVSTDSKKNSVAVTLRSCVACEEQGAIVVGKGNYQVSNGKLLANTLKSASKSFKSAAAAEHWGKYTGGRLRAQFLVKVPSSAERFKAAGRDGYKVEVVGYRLYDPCQGNVLTSAPESKHGPVDSETCKGEPELVEDSAVVETPEDVAPDRLDATQIKNAMNEVTKLTDKCHEAYGIDGTASFKMIIGGNGKLLKVEQSGDFKGTPTGICLDKAVQSVSFPKSKKKETPVTFPIMLQ